MVVEREAFAPNSSLSAWVRFPWTLHLLCVMVPVGLAPLCPNVRVQDLFSPHSVVWNRLFLFLAMGKEKRLHRRFLGHNTGGRHCTRCTPGCLLSRLPVCHCSCCRVAVQITEDALLPSGNALISSEKTTHGLAFTPRLHVDTRMREST